MRSEKELKDRSFHEIKSQTAADRVAKLIKGVTGQLGPCGVTEPPSFPVEVGRYVSLPHQIWHSLFFLLLFDLEVYSTSKTKENQSITSPFQPFHFASFQEPRFSAAWSLPKVIPRATPEVPMATSSDLIREAVQLRGGGRCNRTSQKSSVTLRWLFCSKNLLIPMISNDKIIKSQSCQKSWESSLKIVDCVPFGTAFGGTYPQTSAPVWLLCPWTKRYQAVLLFRLSDSTLVFPPKVVLCRTAHCLLFFLEQ